MEHNSQIALSIEGMTCEGCANTVKSYLKSKGATNLTVDVTTKEAAFDAHESLNIQEISTGLAGIGYHVNLPDTAPVKDTLVRDFWISLGFTVPLFLHMFLPEIKGISHHTMAYIQLGLCVPPMAIGIKRMGRHSWNALRLGTTHMDMLLLLGALSALLYSLIGTFFKPDPTPFLFYETAATIIVFGLLGKLVESRAVGKTGQAIAQLEKTQPSMVYKVTVRSGQESEELVALESLMAGDLCRVPLGGVIPADGIVDKGEGSVDQSMLTGESLPRSIEKGDAIYSGTLLEQGNIRLRLTKKPSDSTLSTLIKTMREAQRDKPKIHRISDRFSKVFVPVVLGISGGVLLFEWLLLDWGLANSLMNAIAVLVISCPCAMGLATPTAVTVSIGRCAKQGMVLRSAQVFERIVQIEGIIFDKTGTLTTGEFTFSSPWVSDEADVQQCISIVSALSRNSTHPVSQSFYQQHKSSASFVQMDHVTEIKGRGIQGELAGETWFFGQSDAEQWEIVLVKGKSVQAGWTLHDDLKPTAKSAIATLQSMGLSLQIMSGDRAAKVAQTAQVLAIENWMAEQRPEQKLAELKTLQLSGPQMAVGDGINDGPLLAQSSVGVSFAEASAVAMHSADVILLNETTLLALPKLFKYARHTIRVIWQNLGWAVSYNLVAIPLAAMGYLDPMIAAFAMAFSDVVVVGNSLRLTRLLK